MPKNYLSKRGEKLADSIVKVAAARLFLLRFFLLSPRLLILSTIILILLLLISSAFVSASHGASCLEITNRRPIFQVNFDEPSNLSLFELIAIKGNAKTPVPVTVPDLLINFSKYYEASVNDLLDPSVKDYILKLKAIDFFDNEKDYEQCYHYVPRATKITLVEPEFGYSSVKPFTVKIKTDAYATCRYSINTDLNYADPNPAQSMAAFKETAYVLEHTVDIKAELFPDNNTNIAIKLYVKCNRTDGEINQRSEAFEFHVDSTKPFIQEVRLSPQGGNKVSNEPLQTTVMATTDEAARCKYSLTGIADYNLMESRFDDYNSFSAASTSRSHSLNFPGLEDKKTYNLKIACENKAKLISDVNDFMFETDKNADDTITILKPNFTQISKLPVELEVLTNRDAQCVISMLPAPGSPIQPHNTNLLIHKLNSIPGISAQGRYNFTVHCDFLKSGGAKAPKELALNLLYDSQAPEILNFTTQNTCIANQVHVKWTAKDLISEITGYRYKLNANTVELFNWSETRKSEVRLDVSRYDVNASADTTYTIIVAAKDSAGNLDAVGKKSQKLEVSNPGKAECLETIAPKSNLTKEFKDNAAYITVTCQDLGGSGCNPESYLYNAVDLSASCSASQKYTAAVKVTNTAIFCWKVSDHAGNSHQGEEKIILNIDSDGDGIPDSIDKCSNTPKSEKADSIGCSPSQKDDDNDGIPNDKDICPETIQEAIDAQAVNSSGCLKDSDNDGMPDYWEMKYKFDINDPSDASKNPDLDGANNLQEYLQGTDPLVSDVDSTKIPDKDGDGVPDTLDKCPETTAGDKVNPQTGCSTKDIDKDEDGMSNECEQKYGLDSENAGDAEEDKDNDGLINTEECNFEGCELELDPNNPDTDEDGYNDGKEYEQDTSPCDAEDKPASAILQYILLGIGILFLSTGIGYLAYKKFVLKESISSSGYGNRTSKEYKLGSLEHPQSIKTSLSQQSKAVAQHRQIFVKKQLTSEQKRKAALQKIKEERKQGKVKELNRAFSGFGTGESAKEEPEIKKIELPTRKAHRIDARDMTGDASDGVLHTSLIHPIKKAGTAIKNIILPESISSQTKELSSKEPTTKEEIGSRLKIQDKRSSGYNKIEELTNSNTAITRLKTLAKSAGTNNRIKEMITAPLFKFKDLLQAKTYGTLENLTRKEVPLEQLKKYTLHKEDIKKIVNEAKDGKDETQVKKIFNELASMNKDDAQKADAFLKLSQAVKGNLDIDEKDIFKELPKKLVPETSKEAAAFTKLSNILEGKPVDDGIKELSKLRAKKTSIDYLKMMAGKK